MQNLWETFFEERGHYAHIDAIQCDELTTKHTKCKPLSVAVDKKERKILGVRVSKMLRSIWRKYLAKNTENGPINGQNLHSISDFSFPPIIVFRDCPPRLLGTAQCRRIPCGSTCTGFTWNSTIVYSTVTLLAKFRGWSTSHPN